MIAISLNLKSDSIAYLEKLPSKAKHGLAKGLLQAMMFAETKSKQIFREEGDVHPSILTARTGNLRRSISSGASDSIGWIGTNVKYGKVHEYSGAGKAKVIRPFLRPAIENNLNEIRDLICEGIVEGIE